MRCIDEDGSPDQHAIHGTSRPEVSGPKALVERGIIDRKSIRDRPQPSDLLGGDISARGTRIVEEAQERYEVVALILGP